MFTPPPCGKGFSAGEALAGKRKGADGQMPPWRESRTSRLSLRQTYRAVRERLAEGLCRATGRVDQQPARPVVRRIEQCLIGIDN